MSVADEALAKAGRYYIDLRSKILVARGEVLRDYSAGYIAGASRNVEVTDDMVERAATVMAESEDSGSLHTARAALSAALGYSER